MTALASPRTPLVFFGHGSPMNAIEDNRFSRSWSQLLAGHPRPKAILCVSAHWLTRGIAVTAMPNPRTVHDFGAFPQALFDVQYPAPGSPELAARVRELLAPTPVGLDAHEWGLDHGSWSVLVHLFPEADVPVVQLSLDVDLSPAEHYAVGRRLAPLREEGVLVIATGNIVHNLRTLDWSPDAPRYDWAERFNDHVLDAVRDDRPQAVIDFASQGEDARLSVPTPEHYWPLLYVLGARHADDALSISTDEIVHGSLSMASVKLQG